MGSLKELAEAEVAAIAERVRAKVAADIATGMDPDERMVCDGCFYERPGPGYTIHGWFILCNDCTLDLELALARGEVTSVSEYLREREMVLELVSEEF